MIKFFPRHLAALSLVFAASTMAAHADDDDDDYRRYHRINKSAAIEIAAAIGVYQIHEIERDDGKWEIEGRTFGGCEIEVEISVRSGRVTDREIDDCPRRRHRDRGYDSHGYRGHWGDD